MVQVLFSPNAGQTGCHWKNLVWAVPQKLLGTGRSSYLVGTLVGGWCDLVIITLIFKILSRVYIRHHKV